MNKDQIEQFREQLLNLRPRLTDEIQRSINTVAEEVRSPGDNTHEPSEGLDHELVLERNQENILNAVNAALDRIQAGTYGQCGECGTRIPIERLKAIPYTDYCIDCEQKLEES